MVAMGKDLEKGDRVSWRSHGGTAVGTIVRRLTSTTKVKGHTAKATADEPQYLVEVDGGGKAAHKPSALRRVRGKDATKGKAGKRRGTKAGSGTATKGTKGGKGKGTKDRAAKKDEKHEKKDEKGHKGKRAKARTKGKGGR
jgi:hypothetical protein